MLYSSFPSIPPQPGQYTCMYQIQGSLTLSPPTSIHNFSSSSLLPSASRPLFHRCLRHLGFVPDTKAVSCCDSDLRSSFLSSLPALPGPWSFPRSMSLIHEAAATATQALEPRWFPIAEIAAASRPVPSFAQARGNSIQFDSASS